MPLDTISYVNAFLQQFGYSTLQEFQERVGLEPSGEHDTQTLRAMFAPRCGVPDGLLTSEEARWRKSELTYYVESYLSGLSRADQDDLLSMAFGAWSAIANVRAKQVQTRQCDIIISTGGGAAQGFDGPFGTLAWAQLPPGDDRQLLMRFDKAEEWLRSAPVTGRGILYLNVATHEIGHLLGLDHSRVRTALMAPNYSPSIATPQSNDDVPRMQSLYGPPAAPPVTPTPGAGNGAKVTITGTVDALAVEGWRCSKMG